jgi:hypothetical protein
VAKAAVARVAAAPPEVVVEWEEADKVVAVEVEGLAAVAKVVVEVEDLAAVAKVVAVVEVVPAAAVKAEARAAVEWVVAVEAEDPAAVAREVEPAAGASAARFRRRRFRSGASFFFSQNNRENCQAARHPLHADVSSLSRQPSFSQLQFHPCD